MRSLQMGGEQFLDISKLPIIVFPVARKLEGGCLGQNRKMIGVLLYTAVLVEVTRPHPPAAGWLHSVKITSSLSELFLYCFLCFLIKLLR